MNQPHQKDSLFLFHFFEKYFLPLRSVGAQCGIAFGSTFGIFIAWAILISVLYGLLGQAEIKVNTYSSQRFYSSLQLAATQTITCNECVAWPRVITIWMSFLVFMIAFISIIGWFGLTICGGCGLTALPLDCCLALCKKERRITFQEWTKEQQKFAKRAEKLIDMGEALDKLRRERGGLLKPKNIRLYRDFKNAVYLIQDDFNLVKRAYKKGGRSPWTYIFNFILGGIFFILSAAWFIHMILWMSVPDTPIWPGLNFFFYVVDLAFPVFGALGYAIFTFYLLLCVMYGSLTIMGRLPLINIYPIKFRDTLVNAFILHTWELLVISVTLIQFVCDAFSGYSNNTSIGVMFFVYVRNVRGFFWFFQYVHYALYISMFFGFWISIIFSFPCLSKNKSQKRLEQILASK